MAAVSERYIIKVYVEETLRDKAAALCSGIEEEGVPYTLKIHCFGSQEYDMTNRFDSGIQVFADIRSSSVNVYFKQLKADRPYLSYGIRDDAELKLIGKNAARLAKKKPLIII